ncbi:MAG TPA: histidine kinase [Clostridiaceae bacterium]|nr:histidine kinase [Clostridiaceae bacterium]
MKILKVTHFKSFRFTVMFSIILLVIISEILLSAFYKNFIVNNVIKQSYENINLYINKFVYDVNSCFNAIKDIVYQILMSKEIADKINKNLYPTPTDLANIDFFISRSILFEQTWQQKFIKSIFLFFDEDIYSSVLRESYYQNTIERNKNIYVKYGSKVDFADLIIPDKSDYAYYISTLSNIYVYKPYGKIIIEIDPSLLLKSDSLKSLYSDTKILIYNSKGDIFFSNQAELKNENVLKNIEYTKNYSFELIHTQSGKYYAFSKDLGAYSLKCLILIDTKSIYGQYNEILMIFFIISAVIMVMSILITLRILKNFFNPLNNLIKEMSTFTVNTSSDDHKNEYGYFNEINTLYSTYNNMSLQINKLVNEVYELKILNQQAELDLLHSQVDPHFLFNILDIIHWQVHETGDKTLIKIIGELANLIRNSLIYLQKESNLKDELEQIKLYIDLQQYIMKDRLQCTISTLDYDKLQHIKIPKFWLKTLVVTFIKVVPKQYTCKLNISINHKLDNIYISITGKVYPICETMQLNTNIHEENQYKVYKVIEHLKKLEGENSKLQIKQISQSAFDFLITLSNIKKETEGNIIA